MMILFFLIWMGYWSAESGASLPWSYKWQKDSLARKAPEIIIAATIAVLTAWGWGEVFNLSALAVLALTVVGFTLALAGKESATWLYLNWEKHEVTQPDRTSTLKPLYDFIGRLLGYKKGDEGYSWIVAAVKGFLITLPIGGTGLFAFPLGHEVGSHAKGRLPGDPNMWKEIASGLGLGVSCTLFYVVINFI